MTVGQGSHRWALLTWKGPLGTVIQKNIPCLACSEPQDLASSPRPASVVILHTASGAFFAQLLSSNSHFSRKKPMLFCSNSDLSIFPRCFSFLHLHPDQVLIMSCLDHHTDFLSSYLLSSSVNTWYITVIQTNKNIIISQPCLKLLRWIL